MKTPRIAKIHLLGHALNVLIEEKLIDMSSVDDKEDGFLECSLLGKPSLISWAYIGFGEIRLTVWWNFDKTKYPQYPNGCESGQPWSTCCRNFVGVTCCVHVERKIGKYLQTIPRPWIFGRNMVDGLSQSYVRRTDKAALLTIPSCQPRNFELKGRIHF